ncbi:MAG TPA: nitroreductase family deazaflavin-dependent oxidoreductase [Ktedonobacterales bacterium]|jgi:deazaflavin-dependent oxidoreductase (nitroreductase family)|nr:nitroreductase family deazaflavin-dependent oxidoreductase [Ktedonobacterales bacterium]
MSAPGRREARRTPGWSRLFVPVHIWLYRATGGLLGHRLGPQRTLLLTTTGRKSGLPRTQAITYFRADDDLVLVASNWGSDRPPAWYLNLLAHPQVHVQLKREAFEAEARMTTHEERARVWPVVVAQNPQHARYQAGTSREIPVVFLRRVPTTA